MIKYQKNILERRLSIQKKILCGMLLTAILPIVLLIVILLSMTQKTMRSQLIENKTQGIDWLSDKLESVLSEYEDFFYEIEINKTIKNALVSWSLGGTLPENMLSEIRTSFSEELNSNFHIKTAEVYNFSDGTGYQWNRVSFREIAENNLDQLVDTDAGFQTNLIIKRDGEDYLIIHQMNEFSSGKRVSCIILRISKYAFSDILEQDMADGEYAVLSNDRGDLLGIYPSSVELSDLSIPILSEQDKVIENGGKFYFLNPVKKGKLRLLYIVPASWINEQQRRTLVAAIIILLGAILLVGLLSVLFSDVISKPIIALSKKMQQTDILNYAEDRDVSRKDEIGTLQKSFDGMMKRNQELVEREYQSELEKQEAQLRTLQAQINPHFLYNTLTVIGGMALTGKGRDIYSVVTNLGDILRYAISFSEEMVMLDQELKYLESYLSIQNYRFNNCLNFEKMIDEDVRNARIPKLILQPLVENSVIHGMDGKSGEWRICLAAFRKDKELDIVIKDNGIGIDPETLMKLRAALEADSKETLSSSAHIGLRNVQARIHILFGKKYGVWIDSEEGIGTTITVRMRYLTDGQTSRKEAE